MTTTTHVRGTPSEPAQGATAPGEPCVVVIFGASGDLTKRLLMPAFYNLACDGLLSKHFAVVGMALDDLSTDPFRARMTEDIRRFHTRHVSTKAPGKTSFLAFTTRQATSATPKPTAASPTRSRGSTPSTGRAATSSSTWRRRRPSSA